MKHGKFLILIMSLVISLSVMAQVAPVLDPLVFDTPQQEERFNALTLELRCTVCQNQTLADSDARVAHDLRQKVHEMLMSGKTDDEIKKYMVERYGDFVLYRPPVQSNTYLLWLAPLFMLLAGGLILRSSIKKRSALLDADENTKD